MTTLNLHCTQKLRDKLKAEPVLPVPTDHWLGTWYATVLMWRPQLVLLVNEQTLLPVLMPAAPASTLVQRLPQEIKRMLLAIGVSTSTVEQALGDLKAAAICKTASRSLVGTMNEFCFLAESYRGGMGTLDPLGIALKLAQTPCGGKAGYRYPLDLVKQKLLQ